VLRSIILCLGTLVRFGRTRESLLLEDLALRQQYVVLKRRHPKPRIGPLDRLLWVAIRCLWSGWKHSLIVVTPETVVRWHRAGFRSYWRLISKARRQVGRRPTPRKDRELIFRVVVENPIWGAPRIHAELLMLGFDLSERTISRWMKRAPRDPEPAKRWLPYYHADRTHLGLSKETPNRRPPSRSLGRILSHNRLGGLYQRYDRAAKAGPTFESPKKEDIHAASARAGSCPKKTACTSHQTLAEFRLSLQTETTDRAMSPRG
jgi:hypothetical protein